jgi:hypothetical protein
MLLATKPMQLAQYFCTGEAPEASSWRHYALAMDMYTHFTSPIRCAQYKYFCLPIWYAYPLLSRFELPPGNQGVMEHFCCVVAV